MPTHVEPVMGTAVGITSPAPLPPDGLAAACRELHEADRIFSTWAADSPLSQLRSGRVTLGELAAADAAAIRTVLDRCALAVELSGGWFDPWAIPGGVDPTGLVKGWAAARALDALVAAGATDVMVNAGGDVAAAGNATSGVRGWRVGIRHPTRPDAVVAVVAVTAAIATSGDYERPGQLVDPRTGRVVPPGRTAASATVTGPDLDLADALATALAVGGLEVLERIDTLDALTGYEAHLITDDGRHLATPGMAFVAPEMPGATGTGSG